MKTTKELKLINIDKLIFYTNNIRTHSKDQTTKLKSNFREFGFINSIVTYKKNNIINGDEIFKKMRPGAKASGSIYILYIGPGNYYLVFDHTMPGVELE